MSTWMIFRPCGALISPLESHVTNAVASCRLPVAGVQADRHKPTGNWQQVCEISLREVGMSKKINVNPGQYKTRGRERQGEDVPVDLAKQEYGRAASKQGAQTLPGEKKTPKPSSKNKRS